jgi:(p)ppGpp synthase/HD superfamily hydrolase
MLVTPAISRLSLAVTLKPIRGKFIDISLVDRAIGFAARAHEGQRRKTGGVPYIAHPVGVAMILQKMGCEETVIAAGLLHDTVEDTKATMEDILSNFGDEVADIVKGCTEPPKRKGNWENRKLHMINTVRVAPISVKLVVAADKYHNLSHTRHYYKRKGKAIWNRFGRGVEQQAWYYRSMLESITTNVPDPDRYPIFEQLSAIIGELFEGIPSRAP